MSIQTSFAKKVTTAVTLSLTIALLGWALVLWQNGAATTGDVILVCTLGLSILGATRDLAVALVDVTQHLARFSEALATLLIPHHLRDHPKATSLVRSATTVAFEDVAFCYPDGRRVFTDFSLHIGSGQRAGLIGQSGCGKSTLIALALLRRAGRTHSPRRARHSRRDCRRACGRPLPLSPKTYPCFTARLWTTFAMAGPMPPMPR